MAAMATIYVRNVPADLYAELQRWAFENGRSVNAEVIELLRETAGRRAAHGRWAAQIEALRAKYPREPGPPWASDVLVEERRTRESHG